MISILPAIRLLSVCILCGLVLNAHPAYGQDAAAQSVRLTDPFVFTLSPHPDNAVNEIVKKITLYDETQRKLESETANSPALTRALDLLRYLPIKLSNS